MRKLFKGTSFLTTFAITISSVVPLTSFAETPKSVTSDVLANSTFEYTLSKNEQVVLNEDVLTENFNLEEKVANMPSVHEMNEEERALFDQLVEEEASRYGGKNKELYKNLLTNFFDQSSEHAHDFMYAQFVLNNAENNNLKNQEGLIGTQAVEVKVGVNFAGSVFNVAIGVAVGGGVGAIQAFIISKGKKEAERLFTRTVVSQLKAWGADKLAYSVSAAVAIALDYSDIGLQIAKQLDSIDKRPNDGWIDIY